LLATVQYVIIASMAMKFKGQDGSMHLFVRAPWIDVRTSKQLHLHFPGFKYLVSCQHWKDPPFGKVSLQEESQFNSHNNEVASLQGNFRYFRHSSSR